ncbi:DUF5983 family protein [Pantoea phytobeneficialis]|uniref:DUF5983 family protein n=1 Tax=Pantoea phytobeneficialis TaxID=2052056 RepID=A0ABT8XSN7_9GAMM|nr:DUF5983 family protein [Pantoea phytobeneficialis]MDO6406467.1 DUF5983 family protein [Pantoea phytobeneficialis]
MKTFTVNAPYGVTIITLSNGYEAVFLHGQRLVWAEFTRSDDILTDLGKRLAEVLGLPLQVFSYNVPENVEWQWSDFIEPLGWGKTVTLPDWSVLTCLECSTAHITREDNDILCYLSEVYGDNEWILATGFGYLIRLDAVSFPILRLKSEGLSRQARKLIHTCHKKGRVSMIYFSSLGDELEFFETFTW